MRPIHVQPCLDRSLLLKRQAGRGASRETFPFPLEFLILFRQEAGGPSPSATWRRQGADEYRDTQFATTLAKLLKYLPRLSKPSLPDHLRVPLSPKVIASLIAELQYPRRRKRTSRRRSEQREIQPKPA